MKEQPRAENLKQMKILFFFSFSGKYLSRHIEEMLLLPQLVATLKWLGIRLLQKSNKIDGLKTDGKT